MASAEQRITAWHIDAVLPAEGVHLIKNNLRMFVAGGGWLLFRMYYGPEFVSRAVLRWMMETNIDTAHIDPGKPWQNGSNESFNGKFRDECLSMQWFKNRTDAKILIENFR